MRKVGVEDLGVDDLVGGVEGLRDGVDARTEGDGLEREDEDGLVPGFTTLLLQHGDGLSLRGLVLLLLVL